MIMFLMYIMLIFGFVVAGMGMYLTYYVPPIFSWIFFIFGAIIAFCGMFLMTMRAIKTGANLLINPASTKNDSVLWFYIKRNGTVKIIPATEMKNAGGLIKADNTDVIVQDVVKPPYRIADHQVRFIPEGSGYASSHMFVLYAKVLKDKHKLEDLHHGRFNILTKLNKKLGD